MRTYIDENDKGIVNGVVPLNSNKKIDLRYLPVYTEVKVTPSEKIASLSAIQTWSSEQTYNYTEYGLTLKDTIYKVAAGFKTPRGLFNQLFVDNIVFTNEDNNADSNLKNEISFYTWQGIENKSDLTGAKKVASITKDGGLALKSSTPNSSKYFKITVDDSGSLNTSEFNFSN